MKANGFRPSRSIPAHAVPALPTLAKISIAGGPDSNDPCRKRERVNGVWVTIHDGTDDGSQRGGL